MNTAGGVVVAILHSKNQWYIKVEAEVTLRLTFSQPICPDHQLLYICDVLHGLNIFPIESANEVTDTC
jgi:hypothetical protein